MKNLSIKIVRRFCSIYANIKKYGKMIEKNKAIINFFSELNGILQDLNEIDGQIKDKLT
jgi:hypothetical protein